MVNSNWKEDRVKKVLAVLAGLMVLALCSAALAGPGCGAKATSAAAAACQAKGTSATAASGEIKAGEAACVEKAIKLSIDGMRCGDCSKKVRAALTNLEGVCASKVSFTRKNAEVIYNAAQLSEDKVIGAVTAAGFTVASTKASNWKLSKEDCTKAQAASATTGAACCKAKAKETSKESGT
jgi:copper chaperone